MTAAAEYGEIDADAIRDFHTQSSPAAASEGMTAVLPARLPLAAGAENEAPGIGIPPPRPVPPDTYFASYAYRKSLPLPHWAGCETHEVLVGRRCGKSPAPSEHSPGSIC